MKISPKYSEYLEYFNKELFAFFESIKAKCFGTIEKSIEYAVKNGGKRVRPVLTLVTAEILGLKKEDVIDFAIAIEFIHSYSLVHDDLPCMDNDDFRRGKPSTHKAFGEAVGVLTGDGLLNLAFEKALDKKDFSFGDAKALKFIAECAGYSGMILGQVLDMENENSTQISEETLKEIYLNKTGKLLIAALCCPSVMCGDKYLDLLKSYGENLGYLFQITDDVLDVEGELSTIGKTPHKDENKLSAVKVYGLNGAKDKAKEYYLLCKSILALIPNSEFLAEFTDYLYLRRN